MSLLPDGSELKGVMLPRYDENRKLVGVLKSKLMRLVTKGEVAGEAVTIEFFNDDQSSRGRIDLAKATFYHEKGLLTAKEDVQLRSDKLTASGSALYYSFERGQGFLSGPGTTVIKKPTETTMNSRSPSLRATAVLGMSLLSYPVIAAIPPKVTEAEIAKIHSDAKSSAPTAATAVAAARTTLEQDVADSEKASQAATAFLVQADLPKIDAEAVPAPDKPLAINPSPDDTVINCEGGMYFDPDEGVLVYLKNVTVTDPRFNLTAKDQLKIFFGKKEPKPDKKEKPSDDKVKDKQKFGGNIGANFGDVERIVATGAVVLDQKAVDGKPPIKASGSVFTYNIKTDQITINGGYPWVIQGENFMTAQEPNLILRISPKAGSFVTDGNWKMGGRLDKAK